MLTYIIYKHTCLSTGKSYIGQTKNYKARIRGHRGSTSSTPFRNAIRKYGWDSFVSEILADGLTKAEANTLERFFIQEHNSIVPYGYNLTTGGEYFEHTNETKQKISKAKKGIPLSAEHKKKLSEAKKGRKLTAKQIEDLRRRMLGMKKSPQHCLNISLARRGEKNPMFGRKPWNTGIPVSEEHKKYLSEKMNHKKKKVIVEGIEFSSMKEASRTLNIHTSTIYNRIASHKEGYTYVE